MTAITDSFSERRLSLARANAMFEAERTGSKLQGVLDPLRHLLQDPAMPFTPSNDASSRVGRSAA